MTGNFHIEPGNIYPLGSTWDGKGVNFALYSAHAEKVELCLFSDDGRQEVQRLALPDCTSHVWNGYVAGLPSGAKYGYRVYGPYQPELGHRFNHHKLLLDPYARQLAGEFTWCNLHYGYQIGSPDEDLSFDARDNAAFMPKCVVVVPNPLPPPRENRIHKRDTVIYEAHVRGLTMRHPELPQQLRGTFAGIGHAALVKQLRELGITSLELLPVQSFVDEQFLLEKGLSNYWGYNTLNFFAPHRAYFAGTDLAEFRDMVTALHEAGIEVILDVVYNHTAEGGRTGPTLSFRGIDNASYYKLQAENPRYYINDTGCGNTLDFTQPQVVKLVLDSLRYWVTAMGVDGFRFDLATVLGREAHGFDRGSGFFDALHQDPVLSSVKFIAEPWDIGPGGYQLGNFPTGWSEWNDRFRDATRRFWRGDAGTLPEFARRLHGSSDIFEHNGRRPSSCINFITCHDGFTLRDLVSYKYKHNEANLEDNRDGQSENCSDNYGVEGPTDDAYIEGIRQRQQRNLLTTLILSQGTPMLYSGDEFGHSKGGNNNTYCHDSPLTWLPWDALAADQLALRNFTRNLLALKQEHPELWQNSYLHADGGVHHPVIRWLDSGGEEMQSRHWGQHNVHSLGYMMSPYGIAGSMHYL
ncbi:MAG TPA: glycogen debranching protein GlgX, partial [Candidatus Acidoferrum sp.]|nr:glycogen debranching protein GlgX [Candidatus Acidoferrum sp.]